MNFLITGGAGFIGSNFLKYLISMSPRNVSSITVLDKLTYSGTKTNFKGIQSDAYRFIEGDILNDQAVQSAIKKVDVLVNFAAESHVDRSIVNPEVFMRTNVLGTQVLLEASLRNGVQEFIQISTDEVYGSIQEGYWTETAKIAPNSPYAASKASADLLALSYFRTFDLDVRIIRSSNNYGPNQFPEKVIPLFITNIIQGKKVPIYGDGKNVREWLYVGDNCRAIYSLIDKGKKGEIYNIGSGFELQNIELAKLLLREMNADINLIEYVEDRKGHDFRYALDFTKSKTEIGYSPATDFELGIRRTIQWYLDEQDWWRPLKVF